MNREYVRENYQYFSGKASDVIRQLAFAGIAVLWIFKETDPTGKPRLPRELIWVGLLCAGSLTLDLMHYLAGSGIWGVYGYIKDGKGIKPTTEFSPPFSINWATNFFFWSKASAMVGAYVLLLKFLSHTLM